MGRPCCRQCFFCRPGPLCRVLRFHLGDGHLAGGIHRIRRGRGVDGKGLTRAVKLIGIKLHSLACRCRDTDSVGNALGHALDRAAQVAEGIAQSITELAPPAEHLADLGYADNKQCHCCHNCCNGERCGQTRRRYFRESGDHARYGRAVHKQHRGSQYLERRHHWLERN